MRIITKMKKRYPRLLYGENMNRPIVIYEDSFQSAWAKAFLELYANQCDAWNVVVQINHPEFFDKKFNDLFEDFTNNNNLISPKHVAHTIFPQTFFTNGKSREKLYSKYWRFYNRPEKDALCHSRTHRRRGNLRTRKFRKRTHGIDDMGK